MRQKLLVDMFLGVVDDLGLRAGNQRWKKSKLLVLIFQILGSIADEMLGFTPITVIWEVTLYEAGGRCEESLTASGGLSTGLSGSSGGTASAVLSRATVAVSPGASSSAASPTEASSSVEVSLFPSRSAKSFSGLFRMTTRDASFHHFLMNSRHPLCSSC